MRISSPSVAYACLAFAICFEVIGTSSMKASAGFHSVGYSIIMLISYVASFSLMTLALEVLDLGVAYATWSGVGTTATAVVAVVVFKEKMTWIKAFAILCVIMSIVFLQLVSSSPEGGDKSKPDQSQTLVSDEEESVTYSTLRPA